MSTQTPHLHITFNLAATTEKLFPYAQPPLAQFLTILSFLYFLNVARVGADHFLHAGVVAMIGIGMVYGTPLADILPSVWESSFTTLGYLGLVGIVLKVFSFFVLRMTPP